MKGLKNIGMALSGGLMLRGIMVAMGTFYDIEGTGKLVKKTIKANSISDYFAGKLNLIGGWIEFGIGLTIFTNLAKK
jgi:hypothetical protein